MEVGEKQQNERSVFVMASFRGGPYHGALYNVKLEHGESGEASTGAGVESPPQVLVPVIKFFDKSLNLPKNCFYEGVRYGSSSKLYLMVNGHGYPPKPIITNNSFVFDTDTASDLQHISPPKAVKPYGAVISAYRMLYYLAHPACSPFIPDPSFERYNPATDLWESLPSCPYNILPKPSMKIVGYAVCYGYILLSMYKCNDYAVMAFHIDTQKWHEVKVTKSRDVPLFLGRAVVVDGIIYSLSFAPNQIMAFSFWRDSDGICILGTPLPLYVMEFQNPPSPILNHITQNLVHLGRLDFCLIETGRNEHSIEHQYLCVTTFRILSGEGGVAKIRTLRSSIFQVDLMGRGCGRMEVNFSFTPDCEDHEPEEDYCPIAPPKSKSESKADGRLYVATGRQQDFFSVPTKVAILS